MTSYDAVVVGAGPNGLVAANVLADRGWSVLVLEEQDQPGGAVRSDRGVHPDFVHDTFSSFYPLAAASPPIRDLELEGHGLVWRHAPAVLGHPTPDGAWALLRRDRDANARAFDAAAPGDGATWLELCELWDRIGDQLVQVLFGPFPPVRNGLGLLGRLRGAGGLDLVRTLLLPASELARRFTGPGPGLLLNGNAGHADIPLTAPGSGLFALLLTLLGQELGFPVPEGGAGRLAAAMVDRLRSKGGELRCSARVTDILVADGRAYGVRIGDGEQVLAERAVLADVAAPHLFGSLLSPESVPPRIGRGMRRFELDPGTVKVDWALSGPVPWASAPEVAPGTVHVSDSLQDMTTALSQVAAGLVPASPFLLTGQMSVADPTRSPAGTESMWAYTHVPQPRSTGGQVDAGDGTVLGVWDRDDCERFADRMQARLERLAPGFGDRVLARRVMGPREMEAHDRNLVNGALNGGTAQLHQQLVFRPVPGMWGRPETGVRGLYLASASAHPGGGVHGAPGRNAARAALAHDLVARPRRLVRR